MTSSPTEGIQGFVGGLPELLQPLIIAGLGMIPYVEGEGSAAIGILVGINPIVAAIAGAAGNIVSVLFVVLLSSRVRDSIVARRSREGADTVAVGVLEPGADVAEEQGRPTRRSKGTKRLSAWLVRFGVPGASILAPLALPTQFTAAFFVASGVKKSWVILWQIVAIVLWTGLVAAAALGLVTLLGWA